MKKSELRKIIKEELVNEKYNYEAEQMDLAEKDND